MDWKKMVGKEVFCKTKDSGVCSGVINEYDPETQMYSLTDKYGENWFISIFNIVKLKEEKLQSNQKKELLTRVNNSNEIST
jgi:hypothetical protein